MLTFPGTLKIVFLFVSEVYLNEEPDEVCTFEFCYYVSLNFFYKSVSFTSFFFFPAIYLLISCVCVCVFSFCFSFSVV